MKIIAIANQKGGVAKTTTAINLGAALAERGVRVLLVDIDPQGNASTGLGVAPSERRTTIYNLLTGEAQLSDCVIETSTPNIALIPSTTELSSSDVELYAFNKRAFLLRDALAAPDSGASAFDVALIDCPPSLNLLTVNALVAAHSVLIPLQSEFFALEGLSQLMLTIREIRSASNPGLRIEGVVLTMVDHRNKLSQMVEKDVRETLQDLVYQTVIPRNVRLSEAPSYAVPALTYDPESKGSRAYRDLADEVLRQNPQLQELTHDRA